MKRNRSRRGSSPWRGLVSMTLCAVLVVTLAGPLSGKSAAAGEEGFLASRVSALAKILGGSPAEPRSMASVELPARYAFEDWETWMQIREDNPVTEEFLAAQDSFAYATAVEVMGEGEDNVIYSPLSLYYALALAASAGEGETAAELLDLLGVDSKETLATQCANLYRLLYRDNEIGVLRIANSLWLQQGMAWNQDFLTLAAQKFYAESYQADFADPATAQNMAAWVARQTGGLLQPEITLRDPNQILSILNTVYFQDQWMDEFNAGKTQPDVFTRADGTQVTCDFMNRQANGGFSRGEHYLRASLGLKNAGSMIFVLPDEGTDLQDLLSTPQALEEALTGGQGHSGELVWKIPKFDNQSDLSLTEALQRLGVTHAFRSDGDFSAITAQDAWISSIQQQARVTINEEGVAAAAFTSIGYAGDALPEDRAEMILDRPFLYAITSSTGNLLFLGVCQDPTA